MVKQSRRYSAVAEKVDTNKNYEPREAIELLKEVANAKFDETVEVHLRTTADPRHAEQMVRGVVVLPHGLGKTVRVLVFASGEAADTARQAGADFVGDDDLIQQIEGGWVEFDVGLAVPDMMPRIGRLGRVLGRRGLMPNPRTGTMVQPRDLARVIQEAKAGRLEYRTDRTAIIHSPFGKASFSADQLVQNLAALMDAINRAKPAAVKGPFYKSAYMTSTMGPGIPLEVSSLQSMRPAE
ncbi:MAG: 50S ribosomal protein L1 [SAR202 cluster bacterium]|nr:50S ribosomal protein L1 [SAR202 cluster bacterium]